ncbi:hypothetical protein G6F54_013963 [Rhizopus delemar]|nr:hypothetical protein G6F54_013963 [Rhizopus delemar]
MPAGSVSESRSTSPRSRSAKLTTLSPGAMETAITTAGVPLPNAPVIGGSWVTRSTRARAPRGTEPPFGSGIGVLFSWEGLSASPLTLSAISEPPIST